MTDKYNTIHTHDSIRIYLIEDDITVLRFVEQTLLERPLWRLVGHSETLSHAKLMAGNSSADVFLVDLGLPDGRGQEMLRWLSLAKPESELLVFTVFGDENRLLEALQCGATGYVLKGCTPEELLGAIQEVRAGGAPISPLLARLLLKQFRQPEVPDEPVTGELSLSEREVQVLKLVAHGYVNREIAKKLAISVTTVGSHVKNLYRKLAVHSRVQAVREAQKRGLL